jgi:hypothetical protein
MPLFKKQKEFLKDFKSKKFRYMLFGGSWSSGKSILQIGILHELCISYPKTRYAIVRKNLPTLKRTSVKTFEKILAMNNDVNKIKFFNRTDWVIYYHNGSEILFVEADITKDPDFNKLRGLELTGCLIEEINETEELVFSIMIGRIGRWNNNLLNDYDFILANCNPTQNWVKEKWYNPWIENKLVAPYYFLQSLPTDNPHNTEQYMKGLDDLPENERKRFKEGDWNYATEEGHLIKAEWYKNQTMIESFVLTKNSRVVMGIDPAREGRDRTLFAYIAEGKCFKFEEIKSDDVVYTAGLAIERMHEYNIDPGDIICDSVGVGGGVIDTMKNKGFRIKSFNGGESPETKVEFFFFKNKRAEAFWLFREALRTGVLEVIENDELRKQMFATTYETKDKYIQITAKEEIKKKLSGRSPDHMDALVMAYYQYRKIPGKIIDLEFKCDSIIKGLNY